ncbi:DNA-directed RNA polymerase III subunit RPC7-like [Portunus trituberculatus]|uniref:DNA-directed RNA polymerase III subunit RPC7-like n=1 Tax=Portunus trituberculatus TaxID=210409 RepID=UPI001E1CE5EA|nr:DNA-directed RNA polymerase III subunit RPC7-like [Portunus trituberculatus]
MGGRGRGRGRGKGMSLEQLGVQKGEVLPDRIVGPPETYPPLEFRPVQPTQEKNLAESYLLVVKKEYREHMQNSQFYIQPGVKRKDIERYSDRYQLLSSHRGQLSLNWSRFPKELHPTSVSILRKKRKKEAEKVKVNVKKARTKDMNVSETLEALEKAEAMGMEDNEEDERENADKAEVEDVEELEEADEELDEGTDYFNSYFDNGDNYLDEEDDALEEGGVF